MSDRSVVLDDLPSKLRIRYKSWTIGAIVAFCLFIILIVVVVLVRRYRRPDGLKGSTRTMNPMEIHGITVISGWGDWN